MMSHTCRGGQSNHMFHVTTSTSATQFLLRIHRHGQNQFFTDAVNFAIFSERGLGPKLFGFFEGGRMEEFIPSKTLNADDVLKPEISYSIGSVFPKYHSIDVPVSKNPKCFQIMRESLREYSQLGGGVYTISSTNVTYSEHPIEVSYEDLNREIDLMERWSIEIFEETVVFCHNDLTCSNILQLNSSKEIMFIDWEYATYNYRGYDIAMHLSETAIVRMISPAGIKINEEFTDNPPNLRTFCEAYVDSANRMKNRNPSNRDLEIDNLMRECEFFWPTTHLFWACLLMKLGQLECNKEINLDSQARDRLAVYFHLKPRTQKIYKENMKK
ncbi:hypothetical protein GCK72_010111 [Caenorhabditis remanei]|uniref:Uncharacterized protein n=1 Tax=Caenorhabditis remanei TaxID=31234 RepID=A0A6A5H5Z9_CAERE|nr:hypothetical protein GCK72_010111 [Caenorhabditis remanei]KAF1761852.1 hypothetical protein GCK72_010111 [Caenorhabditis remanei]